MKKYLWIAVIMLLALPALAGCEGDAQTADDHYDQDHSHHEEITIFEVIDRSEDEVTAYVHVDHWHGSLPEVEEGDNISLGAYIEEDDEKVELDGDHHALGVDLAPGAEEGIVSFDLHGDHVHIIGEKEGTTEVVFQFLHDGEVDYETPPIEVTVGHGHGHDDDHVHEEVTVFDIIDRSADEVTADYHVDHWHGSLPVVKVGDNISLGAYLEDDHGHEIELDGDHHALGVALAPGAEEGIVSFDLHGDHVHIIGEQEGTTEVVFQFLHDGAVEFETEPIKVEVEG